MRTKLSLLAAGLTLGLVACAVGGGDGESEDDPLDGMNMGDAAALGDSGLLGGGTAGLDSSTGSPTGGGTFGGGFDASVADSSVPRDSSVSPVDSSTPAGDAATLGGLGGLLGGLGGLFGGGDAGAP